MPSAAGRKRRGVFRVGSSENAVQLIRYLVAARSCARTYRRNDASGAAGYLRKLFRRPRRYAAQRALPAGMDRGDRTRGEIAQKHRHAVRISYRQQQLRRLGVQTVHSFGKRLGGDSAPRVGFGRFAHGQAVGLERAAYPLGTQPEQRGGDFVVLVYVFRAVALAAAAARKIEGGKNALRHASPPQRKEMLYPVLFKKRRYQPVRNIGFFLYIFRSYRPSQCFSDRICPSAVRNAIVMRRIMANEPPHNFIISFFGVYATINLGIF